MGTIIDAEVVRAGFIFLMPVADNELLCARFVAT